jgi:hypothetical protein
MALVALVVAIALLVLIPTRRLFLAGWSGRSLLAYFVGVVALGVVVAELRAPARFLIPLLVIAYIAPFVTARDGVRRLFGRSGRSAGPIVRPADRPVLPPPPVVVPPGDPDAATARPVGSSGPDGAAPRAARETDDAAGRGDDGAGGPDDAAT